MGMREARQAKSPIRAMREALGMSQAELASRAGIDPGYLSKLESGKRNPSPYFRDHLARVIADAMTERAAS